VGVEYDWHGTRKQAHAGREVILSGGAINSPALLQLSGIGDGQAQRDLGIPVVHDLPGVGQNLQDHMGVYVQHECLQPITMYRWFRPDRAAAMMAQVMLFGTGVGPVELHVAADALQGPYSSFGQLRQPNAFD